MRLLTLCWNFLHCVVGHIGSITARDAFELGMDLKGKSDKIINKQSEHLVLHLGMHTNVRISSISKGYDPGLSIQSALKLPRSLELTDSIAGKTRYFVGVWLVSLINPIHYTQFLY